MFSHSRETKLSAGAFGFRCNARRKKNHELARVHVNALGARSVTAASPPFCQT